MSTDRELIEAAIAAGKLRKITEGESGLPPRAEQVASRRRFAPELCGKGLQRLALPHLDQLDGDWT